MYKNIIKEDIHREYTNKVGVTGRQAAKKLGVTYKAFKNKLERFNISFKKRNSKYKQLNDKEWVKNRYFVNKKSVREIAEEIGSTVGAVQSSIKWAGLELRSSKEGLKLRYPNGRFGENASNWKGGRRKGGSNGQYIMILNHEHPNADTSGYVMEHRLVMEQKLGRYLTKDEIVHHLDGNGNNNNIKNLQLTTRKKHFKNHFDAVKYVDNVEKENSRLKKLLNENNIVY